MIPSISFSSPRPSADFSSLFDSMSLEEKVGQILMAHFPGETVNDAARTLIRDVKVGGIIYYNWANGLRFFEQVKTLSAQLQHSARENRMPIPLFIAADQEGGVVERLTNEFTTFPGNRALAATKDLRLAKDCALAIGRELSAAGVNMNLAPVVDVNVNLRNSAIGVRSFGNDPKTVLAFGKTTLEGYAQTSTIAVLKHFPGHGNVEKDSHYDLPIVKKTMEELERTELFPFEHLASAADAIMTAHILVPALDPAHCATLSRRTLSHLKEQLGFKGMIISDSLVMEGVLKTCSSVDGAAIQAINAGCDMLILGGRQLIGATVLKELTVDDVKHIHGSIADAVKRGKIPEERLNSAVKKVIELKNRYLAGTPENCETPFDAAAHSALAETIARRSLEMIEVHPIEFSEFSTKKIALFAPTLLKELIQKTRFPGLGRQTGMEFFDLDSSGKDFKTIANEADVLIFFSYNAWSDPFQLVLIRDLFNLGKPNVLITTRDPLDSALFPEANVIFNTFSPTLPSIEAVYRALSLKKA